jgi:Concanavalin A-like lectin/glucanases superfamily
MSITIRSAQTIRNGITLRGSRGDSILYLDAANPASYPGTGGTWYDLSGYGRDATLVNAPIFNYNSIDFDYNNNQFAVIGPTNMFSGGDMTAIGWVYIRSYQSWSRLFDFGNGELANNVILAISEGTFGLPTYSTTGADNIYSSQTLPLNQWVQLVAVQTGSTGLIYINGTRVASAANTGIENLTRMYNYIGRSNWSSDAYLDGKVSSLKIWNRALTAGEILADYNNNRPASLPILFELDASHYSGSGTDWTDLSGQGRDATIYGSPTWDNTDASGSFVFTHDTTKYIEIPGSSNGWGLNTASNNPNATFSVWAKISPFGYYQHIAGWRGGFNFWFLILPTARVEARFDGGTPLDINLDFTPYYDTWIQATFVVDSALAQTRLYINASLVGSHDSITGAFGAGSSNFRLGCDAVGDNFAMNGKIGGAIAYSRALTQSEITEEFNRTKTRYGL